MTLKIPASGCWRRFGFAALVLLGVGSTAPSRAQNPAPLPAPKLHLALGGDVSAMVQLADGSVVFGGFFDSVNGVPRGNIAKLAADGSLADWSPEVYGTIGSLAADAAGNVYVGGFFYTVNGQPRENLAKIRPDGSLDAEWEPKPDGSVDALAVDALGNVYAGGLFESIGGQPRTRLAKLSGEGSGAADPGWNKMLSGSSSTRVQALAVDGDALYVGGQFSHIDAHPRANVAKFSLASGEIDSQWTPSADDAVEALALDRAGNLYVGGGFYTIGGQARRGLAKLASSGAGAIDPDWKPLPNNTILALASGADGSVYAGGEFNAIGGQPYTGLAKLSGSGAGVIDLTWNASTEGRVKALLAGSAGKIYVGGQFGAIAGQSRLGFAAVSTENSSTVAGAVDVETPARVEALVRLPDGGMLVSGWFEKADGLGRERLLRLRADGTLDAEWQMPAVGEIKALAVDAAGDVYVGGDFESLGGLARGGLAKISRELGYQIDPHWDPHTDWGVSALATDANGHVYAAGTFRTIGGVARDGIAKLSASGTGEVDLDWNPGSAGGGVDALVCDEAGNVYIGGSFTSTGGQARLRIAKLSGTGSGTADPTWNPAASGRVLALKIDQKGYLYAAGTFSQIGGQARSNIAKLAPDDVGAADPDWNPAANDRVHALEVDTAGNVYAAGDFRMVGGQTRTGLAKLSGGGTGSADATWNPASEYGIAALAIGAANDLYVGGEFKTIGGQPREGLAALPTVYSDFIFVDGFDPLSKAAQVPLR